MLEYNFATITAQQALTIAAGDTITFSGGPARTVSVVYEPDGVTIAPAYILLTYGGRTVTFGTGLSQLNKTGGLVFGDGSQLFVGDATNERFNGGAGDDGAYGGMGADTLIGGAGADVLQGNSGDDVLVGGDGGDTIYGGKGDDVIYASREANGVPGEAGDVVNGNLGEDEIFGGAGSDTLLGGQGNDFVGGGDGNDWLSGDLGNDEVMGGLGADTLQGGAGDDTLNGGFGADVLNGGDGNDSLFAQGPEAVTINGGAGNDTLAAVGSGRDILTGGEGRDRFEFVSQTDPAKGIEAEIRDWEGGDQLHFAGVGIASADAAILPLSYSEFVAADYASALAIANDHIAHAGATYVAAQVGKDVYVFADTGDPADGADIAILLVGKTLADIGLSNFD